MYNFIFLHGEMLVNWNSFVDMYKLILLHTSVSHVLYAGRCMQLSSEEAISVYVYGSAYTVCLL